MQYLSSFCFTLAKGPRTMDNAIKAIDPDSPLAGKVRISEENAGLHFQ